MAPSIPVGNGHREEENTMCTEASYSYACFATKGNFKDSSCTLNIVQGSVTGYKDVFNVGERTLMSAVARQPVSTAIEAHQSLRQTCTSGVLITSCGTKLDRSILAAGYGTDACTDHWKGRLSVPLPSVTHGEPADFEGEHIRQ